MRSLKYVALARRTLTLNSNPRLRMHFSQPKAASKLSLPLRNSVALVARAGRQWARCKQQSRLTISSHPLSHSVMGGSKIILKHAGKDAAAEHEPIHPPNAIPDNLPQEKHLSPLDMGTVEKVKVTVTDEEKCRLECWDARPSLEEILYLSRL
ncbi:hypothetical protein FA95DRAFT_771530 [Auriscalpium vulgare]|uniref:Uncharacterized protein n=1 Tax=Auriscalpium vulgare TaxID=40419 RepID=A0ACB8RAC0_9AGAM|nr:hypothetical protein FA95DRAFT_771530 [Auriscalpium vulgare]